jgi:isocitrate/isopropylmalate dehydrogenase
MGKRKIGVIPGDGIGPEITSATIEIIESVGFEADWVYLEGGIGSVEKGHEAMPADTMPKFGN